MIKRKNNFFHFDLFLIICGVVIMLCKHSYLLLQDINEDRKIKVFLSEQKTINKEVSIPNEETDVTHTSTTDYIALIKIPKINLKKGLCNINSKCNNVNQNIQILKDSDYPNVDGGNFILAGHSGTRNISYFKNLENMYKAIYLDYNEYLDIRLDVRFKSEHNDFETGEWFVSKGNRIK